MRYIVEPRYIARAPERIVRARPTNVARASIGPALEHLVGGVQSATPLVGDVVECPTR